jgi:hypothetical protein
MAHINRALIIVKKKISKREKERQNRKKKTYKYLLRVTVSEATQSKTFVMSHLLFKTSNVHISLSVKDHSKCHPWEKVTCGTCLAGAGHQTLFLFLLFFLEMESLDPESLRLYFQNGTRDHLHQNHLGS